MLAPLALVLLVAYFAKFVSCWFTLLNWRG